MSELVVCKCGCTQKIIQEVKDILADNESDGLDPIAPDYGTYTNDIIVRQWTELYEPWEWISKCETLCEHFEKFIDEYKTEYKGILYRGTDYDKYKNLNKEDIIDYSARYTSWTTNIEIANNFTNPEFPIILVFNGNVAGLHINHHEDSDDTYEWIIPPHKFKVTDIRQIFCDTENIKEQKKAIKATIKGKLINSDCGTLCKIYYLELLE